MPREKSIISSQLLETFKYEWRYPCDYATRENITYLSNHLTIFIIVFDNRVFIFNTDYVRVKMEIAFSVILN